MTIHVDKEKEWDPFVKKIMDKLNDLEKSNKKNEKKLDTTIMKVDYIIKKKKVE